MQKLAQVVGGALMASVGMACADAHQPTAPTRSAASAEASADVRGADQVVSLLDACDGPSFAAQGVACTRTAGLAFSQFIAVLTARQSVAAWRFAPGNVTLQSGQTFSAVNRGGEVHTFTEVAHFGGGIVPVLNQLSGNPTPAPECLALSPSAFIPPGGSSASETPTQPGTMLLQCCIHPWMRATVTVTGG